MPFDFKTTFSTPFFDIEEGLDPKYPDTQPYYRLTSFDSVLNLTTYIILTQSLIIIEIKIVGIS